MSGARRASAVLRALADLAPSAEQNTTRLAIPVEWFRWLDVWSVRMFDTGLPRSESHYAEIDKRFGERLAAVDQIRPEHRSLRVGWLFVAGRSIADDERTQRVFHPLVTVPVRVERALINAHLVPAGDVEITELVDDVEQRRRLESDIQVGGGGLYERSTVVTAALLARMPKLQKFALEVASAARLPADSVVPPAGSPEKHMRRDGLVVVAGVGVYATHETGATSRAGSLRAWAAQPLDRPTAFHSLYVTPGAPSGASREAIDSPFALTPAQQHAVVRSRHDPITLISGAPGTGKSHTVVAIACDALGRGESVLVAAKSDATVDALLDLLERAPGPDPVVFGSNSRREALATRLAAGQLAPVDRELLGQARHAFEQAREAVRRASAAIATGLRAEAMMADGAVSPDEDRARARAPRLFDSATDMAAVERELALAARPATGWWRAWRQRRRLRAANRLCGTVEELSLAELEESVAIAQATRVASQLVAEGGLEFGDGWRRLAHLADAARDATARWLKAESRSGFRLNEWTLPAVAALATALRSGRAARRDQLTRLDDPRLTRALPLWVGSLPDIDDLLPAVSGLFDLVVLDEASSIDQPLAAAALLRARRGVVVGDPRQLRHVSFLSDSHLADVIELHNLASEPLLAARLDVRRNSTFDVAAAVAPVIALDEHFRSAPHLVDFVAERLYRGELKVATRAPSTVSRDCVCVVWSDGRRDRNGVVMAEVSWVIAELRSLLREGAASVGVISPFRSQADAIEAAVLEAFTVDDLEALDLRVGTVHAFQGNERDVVIGSVGIGPDEKPATWRFVEDPHLFNVFVTRARKRMTFVLSAEPPPRGLFADYLARVDSPPGPPVPAGPPASSWVDDVAAELAAAGLDVVTSYPTGRHVIDICVDLESRGRTRRDVAIECGVHPDGPDAHIARHLALLGAGWEVVEAFPSKWAGRRGELIVELLRQFGS